jgi:hypothetical protein
MQSLYHADGDQTGLRGASFASRGRLIGVVDIAHSQEWLCYFAAHSLRLGEAFIQIGGDRTDTRLGICVTTCTFHAERACCTAWAGVTRL